jgi:hypothetical protein
VAGLLDGGLQGGVTLIEGRLRVEVVLQRKKPAIGWLSTYLNHLGFFEREKGFEPSTSTLAVPENAVSGRSWLCQVLEIA